MTATGGNLTYQWASAPSGSSSFTAINGATASSYTTAATTLGQPVLQYMCTVTNSAGSTPSTTATLTVVASVPTTNYVTSFNLGKARNDFTGWVGMSITVGGSPVTVTALGRMFASGNTGSHTVKIVNAANSQDVSGGSATVSMSDGTAGSFVYVNLASPVTLNANTTYYIMAQETQGGDIWYDMNTTIQTTNVAAETASVYSYDGATYYPLAAANQSYGPVDFYYSFAISVGVAPTTASLSTGDIQQFTAILSGDTGVTWALSPNTNSGSITTGGLYVAPSSIPSTTSVTVTATSTVDTTKSASAVVTLNPPALPIITQQAQNATAIASQTATFSVTATGGDLSYQWQSEPPGASSFEPIEGATSSSYTTPATTQVNNGVQFQCVVTNPQGSTTSIAVTLTVTLPTSAFVTSDTFGAIRNNYDGYIGMKIVVGSSPLSIVSLGRIFAPGNSGTHQIKIVDASAGSDEDSGSIYYVNHPGVDIPGGSTTVNMAGGTPGSFVYANLPSPITLNANTPYYILSLETNGGDSWYDHAGTTAQTTTVAALTNAVYGTGSPYAVKNDSTGTMYGPVDFEYVVLPAVPVITQQPVNVTVAIGQTATFSMIAMGGNLSYQWESEAPGASTFSVITGATESAYTTPAMPLAQNGTQYMCVVTNTVGSASSSAAMLTVVASLPTANYVTSVNLGKQRNDFSGWVGMSITVGGSPLTVTALGQMFTSGNTGSHTVKIVSASNSQDVSGGSVSVSMSGGTGGNFVYANLPAAVTLNANTTYYIVGQETQGGDQWYDYNTTIQTSNVATETTSVYSYDGIAYYLNGPANQSYGPVNFLYTIDNN